MPKITYTTGKGLVQSAGTGVTLATLPKATVTPLTSSVAVVEPGVYTISGTSAKTIELPAAASVPGGHFTFRNLSAKTHALTGSAADAGNSVFRVTNSNVVGSKITTVAEVGDSITMVSDGLHFVVYAISGSLSFSGT